MERTVLGHAGEIATVWEIEGNDGVWLWLALLASARSRRLPILFGFFPAPFTAMEEIASGEHRKPSNEN
jgi:hypothetical protein